MMLSIGEIIKYQRLQKRLSQSSLAERLGVSSNTVHRWEAGTSIPLGLNRRRLLEELQLDPDEWDQWKAAEAASLALPVQGQEELHLHIHVHVDQRSLLRLVVDPPWLLDDNG